MNAFRDRRFRTADGLTLAADVGGPEGAPTVILMHGVGQTRHSWRRAMLGMIARGYHVVNYDARGHGESDWAPDGRYDLEALSADLLAILATQRRPLALVGASMGGLTSFFAVGSSSEPIADCLVLVDIVLHPAKAGVEHIRQFMTRHLDGFASLDEAADAVAAYNPKRPQPKDHSGLMKNLRLHADGRLYWHWDPRLFSRLPLAEPPASLVRALTVAPSVTLPVLLVRGRHSDVVTDESVASMRAIVPHMEVFDVAQAGHMVVGDRNDAFNQGVLGFLQRTLPPAA